MKQLLPNTSKNRQGFTLIELMVSVAILAILAVIGFIIFHDSQIKARDARRKADLNEIRLQLENYYVDNRKYPPSTCGYGCNNYYYSVDSGGKESSQPWIPQLSTYTSRLPLDPVNNAPGPWSDGNYSYAYGNVTATGQAYVLTAQLENASDSDRCEVKDWKWEDSITGGLHWCKKFGGTYSNQIYEAGPGR